MPLNTDLIAKITAHLERVSNGERLAPIDIGELTAQQFSAINLGRAQHGLPAVDSPVIVYSGRHHFESRLKDGYVIADMIVQLHSGLGEHSVVRIGQRTTLLRNPVGRQDGYGNLVFDEIVLELLARKPKAEAFSAIPRGDKGGPANKKPLVGGA